jgi:hypothetical protein
MKFQEQQLARDLRKKGWSINQIYKKLSVAKGSVSLWVREVELTSKQLAELGERSHKQVVIEKRRQTRLFRENARRQIIVDKARAEISHISTTELFLIGIALYWAEGSKTKRGVVELSNANPELIKVAMRFFLEICKVPELKFRGHIFLHPHLDSEKAEKYWSEITHIPRSQFFKTSMQQSRASKKKKDTLPYGTFAIVVCDTELFLRIKGWTEGVYNNLLG